MSKPKIGCFAIKRSGENCNNQLHFDGDDADRLYLCSSHTNWTKRGGTILSKDLQSKRISDLKNGIKLAGSRGSLPVDKSSGDAYKGSKLISVAGCGDGESFIFSSPNQEGIKECIIVDAGSEFGSGQVAAEIVNKNRYMVKAILITHPHPDHYNGLSELFKNLDPLLCKSIDFLYFADEDKHDFSDEYWLELMERCSNLEYADKVQQILGENWNNDPLYFCKRYFRYSCQKIGLEKSLVNLIPESVNYDLRNKGKHKNERNQFLLAVLKIRPSDYGSTQALFSLPIGNVFCHIFPPTNERLRLGKDEKDVNCWSSIAYISNQDCDGIPILNDSPFPNIAMRIIPSSVSLPFVHYGLFVEKKEIPALVCNPSTLSILLTGDLHLNTCLKVLTNNFDFKKYYSDNMSDLTENTENGMVLRSSSPSLYFFLDVLKVSHHGSPNRKRKEGLKSNDLNSLCSIIANTYLITGGFNITIAHRKKFVKKLAQSIVQTSSLKLADRQMNLRSIIFFKLYPADEFKKLKEGIEEGIKKSLAKILGRNKPDDLLHYSACIPKQDTMPKTIHYCATDEFYDRLYPVKNQSQVAESEVDAEAYRDFGFINAYFYKTVDSIFSGRLEFLCLESEEIIAEPPVFNFMIDSELESSFNKDEIAELLESEDIMEMLCGLMHTCPEDKSYLLSSSIQKLKGLTSVIDDDSKLTAICGYLLFRTKYGEKTMETLLDIVDSKAELSWSDFDQNVKKD